MKQGVYGAAFRYRVLPDAGFEYVSPAIVDLVGYDCERFYANPDFDLALVHPDDRGRLLQAAHHPWRQTLLRWFHRNGSVVWLEVVGAPEFGANGAIMSIDGLVRLAERATGEPRRKVIDTWHEGRLRLSLSERECDVLAQLIAGSTNEEVAVSLELSRRTVERHVANILLKLGVPNRAAAVAAAHEWGLHLTPDLL
jgi:DNA-binding CsgD family transcriptional regulator